MREQCPNCGSTDLVLTNGSYSTGCGCLGLLLFGWIGLLLGLLGLGNYELVCKHCGSRWPVGKPQKARSGTGCGIFLLLIIVILIILACGCQFRNYSLVGGWVLKNSSVKTPPTLCVAKNGSFYGNGGVNRYFGKLALPFDDGTFKVQGSPGVTMMFGPDLDKEQIFLKNLTSADRWQINKDGELQLLKGDKVLAVFYAKVLTSNEIARLNKPEEKD